MCERLVDVWVTTAQNKSMKTKVGGDRKGFEKICVCLLYLHILVYYWFFSLFRGVWFVRDTALVSFMENGQTLLWRYWHLWGLYSALLHAFIACYNLGF